MRDLLKKMQSIEVEMLKIFISICKENNLKYFLIGGSCLGAIRHKGFIPWDDDIDVGMPREDYEKFLEIAQEKLPPHLFLQTQKTDKQYYQNFAKIRNSNTSFMETYYRFLNINKGVFIDIFPLDGYKYTKFESMLLFLYTLRIRATYYIKKRSLKAKLGRLASLILVPSLKTALKNKEKLMRKYKYNESEYVVNHCGGYGKKEIMKKEIYGEGVAGKFEGIDVILPSNPDAYLKALYNNYMQLPPEEKRVSVHYTDVIDVDKPYTYYQNNTQKKESKWVFLKIKH